MPEPASPSSGRSYVLGRGRNALLIAGGESYRVVRPQRHNPAEDQGDMAALSPVPDHPNSIATEGPTMTGAAKDPNEPKAFQLSCVASNKHDWQWHNNPQSTPRQYLMCPHCKAIDASEALTDAAKVTGQTSDGYHTFDELYHYRMLYNAALFNEWARAGLYDVHKSVRHSDGEVCFDGRWFVVCAQLPTGQITNHYLIADDWYKFQIPIRQTAAEWDGHTPKEAAERLEGYLPTMLTGVADA